MPNDIYEIFANGQKIGIVVAADALLARQSAHGATTRRTESKIDVSCDYEGLTVCRLVGPALALGPLLLA